MDFQDFKVGTVFYTGAGKWHVIGKSERFVLAVADRDFPVKDALDSESVILFDYYDFGGCDLSDRFT